MAWYDNSIFYHIYPLGLFGSKKENDYQETVHCLPKLKEFIPHWKNLSVNAIYLGPLFESVGHGYETTDYFRLDRRLGDNQDLIDFVELCHSENIRVVFDGVFNHVGRDFFAFKDLQLHRENSPYKDWFCHVNWNGNNQYQDGFSYENWGGYDLLVKLNQHNPQVREYISDVVRFWIQTFDVDGIRLDAADVLDFQYMKMLREVSSQIKEDFWLMGEVIHGDYLRWVNDETLHSVTNYHLHKGLFSGHNDHNYFEIAHTVKRLYEMGGGNYSRLKLYNFVDNHDVDRIYSKLTKKQHFTPIHFLLYTLPGIPSLYYGSEFFIEGKKTNGSDDPLRPCFQLSTYLETESMHPYIQLLHQLGKIRISTPALCHGEYKELLLTNRQYVFSRTLADHPTAIVAVNNDDSPMNVTITTPYDHLHDEITKEKFSAENFSFTFSIPANSGRIFTCYDLK